MDASALAGPRREGGPSAEVRSARVRVWVCMRGGGFIWVVRVQELARRMAFAPAAMKGKRRHQIGSVAAAVRARRCAERCVLVRGSNGGVHCVAGSCFTPSCAGGYRGRYDGGQEGEWDQNEAGDHGQVRVVGRAASCCGARSQAYSLAFANAFLFLYRRACRPAAVSVHTHAIQ